MKGMKIGITCYPTYGGSGVVATELGMELAQRGHEVHFITYQPPFRLVDGQPNIHFHEVHVPNYPLFLYPPYDLALATRMAEVASTYALDLLHVHYAIPHSASALLAKQMLATARNGMKRHLPFVTTLHGTDITLVGLEHSYLPVTRFSIEQSDGVTAVSQYLKEKTIKEFDVQRPIEVIHNFVNCDIYKRSESGDRFREKYSDKGEKILIHLSNFRPVKRVLDTIEIFSRVSPKIPSRLLMVGDGPERSNAEYLVAQKKLQDRVHFLGKHEQVEEILGASDLMLMPSELESFGLAALEAMACKVPTIATRSGGVPELIEHNKNGMLAQVGDVETMAKYAVELLTDDARLKNMGENARFEAQTRFCTTNIIPRYEEFYEKVIRG